MVLHPPGAIRASQSSIKAKSYYYRGTEQHLGVGLLTLRIRVPLFMAQRTSTGANLLAAQYRLRGNEWQYLGGAWVRQLLNEILFETIQTDDPEKLFRDNFARFESLGDRRGIIRAVMHLGNIAFMKEEYDKAQGNFQIALDHALALGEKWGAAGCYHKLGQVARARGNYPLALQIFQDGLELLKKVDDPRRTGFILRELGGVARVQGEHSASWEYYRESLQIAKKIGAEALALETLTGVASLLAETGEPERGVALLTLALTHPASEQLTQNRAAQILQILHERGTKDTVTQEHGKGRSQPLEETIESILGNSIVSRSNEHGKHFF